MVDVIGTVAIVTLADRSGMSLSITVNYMAPGPVDGAVEIESTVAKSGKQNAVAVVQLRNAATGAIIAFGTHTKAMVPQSDLRPLWALTCEREQPQQQAPQPPNPDAAKDKGIASKLSFSLSSLPFIRRGQQRKADEAATTAAAAAAAAAAPSSSAQPVRARMSGNLPVTYLA